MALENYPRGDNFRRDFMGDDESVIASISFSEETFISREKNPNKNLNRYITSEHKDPFDAIRTNVPKEISEITKLKPENLQSQGDRYFLLGKTPGQVSSELNRVVGLQIIDDKRKLIKGIVSDTTSRVKVLNSQIKETEENLEAPEFLNIDYLEGLLKKIDEEINDYNDRRLSLSNIAILIRNIERQKEVSDRALNIINNAKMFKQIEERLTELHLRSSKLSELWIIVSKIGIENAIIDQAKDIIAFEKHVTPFESRIDELNDRRFELSKIKTLVRGIEEKEKTKIHMLQKLAEYDNTLSELKERLDYCDKCGSDKEHWNLDRIK